MTKTNLPTVSVIAPCRNESAFIEKAIKTILHSDYPAELIELLVVDGMSTDGTREIVRKMTEQDSRIKLLDNSQKIVPAAMNIGIKASRGEYVIRIDCHSTFAGDYISKCVEVSQRTGADNVGGYIETLPGADTAVAGAIAKATSNKFGIGNSVFRLNGSEKEVDTVPFGTFRRELFDRIGFYDQRLVRNQDIELNARIRKAGGRVTISPEIKLGYYNRPTFRSLWRQSFNNALWNPYTLLLAGRGPSLRHFIPLVFVLGLIILVVGAFFFWFVKWILLGYALFYLAVACYFSIQSTRQTNVSALLVLWSFVTLHTAYGLGTLWSIITIPFKFICHSFSDRAA